MPRRPANVTQADIARVLRAYRDAGLPEPCVVIRADGIAFEPRPVAKGEVAPERGSLAEEREPWIMS